MKNGRVVETRYIDGEKYGYDITEYKDGRPIRRIMKFQPDAQEQIMEIEYERVGEVDVYREYVGGMFVGMWAESNGRIIFRSRGNWWEVYKYDNEGRPVEYRTAVGFVTKWRYDLQIDG